MPAVVEPVDWASWRSRAWSDWKATVLQWRHDLAVVVAGAAALLLYRTLSGEALNVGSILPAVGAAIGGLIVYAVIMGVFYALAAPKRLRADAARCQHGSPTVEDLIAEDRTARMWDDAQREMATSELRKAEAAAKRQATRDREAEQSRRTALAHYETQAAEIRGLLELAPTFAQHTPAEVEAGFMFVAMRVNKVGRAVPSLGRDLPTSPTGSSIAADTWIDWWAAALPVLVAHEPLVKAKADSYRR